MDMRYSAFILFGSLIFMMTFAQNEVFGFPIGFGQLPIHIVLKICLGAFCTLVIFLGILLHEIAHSITARMLGHEVQSITIMIFGGEAKIQKKNNYGIMKGEEIIAFMGPASNLATGLVFLLMSSFLSSGVSDPSQDILITFLSVLGFFNLIIGIFNLLPGYPFDGGLILRSFLRRRMDQETTTMTAVKVCRTSAIFIGAFGFWGNDITFIFIAVLLYLTAYLEDPEFDYKIE